MTPYTINLEHETGRTTKMLQQATKVLFNMIQAKEPPSHVVLLVGLTTPATEHLKHRLFHEIFHKFVHYSDFFTSFERSRNLVALSVAAFDRHQHCLTGMRVHPFIDHFVLDHMSNAESYKDYNMWRNYDLLLETLRFVTCPSSCAYNRTT